MARKRDAKASGPLRPPGSKPERRSSSTPGPTPEKVGGGLEQAGRGSPVGGGSSGRGLGQSRSPSPRGPGRSTGARPRQQVIPDAVANRMARRIAIATGIPTLMGMGVFVGSYLVVSRGLLDIPPGATLVASGACFLLGLVGLSYGVLSSSWEDAPGSLFGREQIGLNISRLRESIRAMRQGAPGGPQG